MSAEQDAYPALTGFRLEYVLYRLREVDRLSAQGCQDTQIGRDYLNHAHHVRQEVHLLLCGAVGTGHAACRMGTTNCPAYLAAVALLEQVQRG